MKSPISLCLIVKNEPQLEACLISIKDYVSEIVIVDTGSTDGTAEVAKKYADIFEVYTDCNNPETGLIEDFSMARNRSFELATQPWVMWCDGDDIIEGGEHLVSLVQEFELNKSIKNTECVAFLFPYEYAYDENGQCILRHYRERLFSNKKYFNWINPVHEVVIPINDRIIPMIPKDEIVFKHQRQFSNKVHESGRNLRILQKYYEKVGDSDARQLYYLGLEYSNSGMTDKAIESLTKYINISGWEDERVMACLKLIDIYFNLGQYENGLPWAFKSIEIKEDWCEGYLSLSKLFYFIALQGGPNEIRHWQRCVFFGKKGLELPPTKTLLFINPLDRDYYSYIYLNFAFNKLGDVQSALDCANIGLLCKPNDPALIANKELYENFISREKIVKETNTLQSNQVITEDVSKAITALINNQTPVTLNSSLTSYDLNNFPIAAPTSDLNEWLIPNTYDFTSYPLKMNDNQLQAVVIMMWKQFMLHDEVLAAISLLENAPYRIRHSFATEKALSLTKSCLTWLNNKDEFQSANAPANTQVESGINLPHMPVLSEGARFYLVLKNLLPNSKLIDFGSMDGCFTNRYGLHGHEAWGLDACQTSVALANKKAAEFSTNAHHICTYFQEAVDKVPSKYFDYATSTDTYEHLADPVNNMLIPAKQMLKEDGKFLLVTPHGSWMRGEYVPWAHPWCFEKENKNWLSTFPRGHVVAPSVWSVADHFNKAGYWVKNSYVTFNKGFSDVEGQGNVFTEACLQAPANDNKLDIVFFIGDGVEYWTPNTVKNTGIGGSELMAIEMSKRLALLGHRVRVYASCQAVGEGIYDGVEYRTTNKYQDLTCDVLVVSRRADYLDDCYNIKAKLKLLWIHDVCAINATNERLLKADRILCLTEWHKQNVVKIHNVHPSQVIVTRNGIDLTRFDQVTDRNQFKCVNSSSPDRSWPILFQTWPEIKRQVPLAELHLYYGFKNWEYSAKFDPKQKDLINYLKLQINSMKELGVVFHDRVDQYTLAKELLSAGVWTFPSWFSETSCISAMEMQAAGVRIVTSNIAALKETVGARGVLLDGEWTSEEYQKQFIEATVDKLTNSDNSDRQLLQDYAKENFCLNKLAQEWQNMFCSLIEKLKVNPIILYYPTPTYQSTNSFEEESNFDIIKPIEIIKLVPAEAEKLLPMSNYNAKMSAQQVKLNIGAGPNIFPYEGWINYDRAFFNEYFTHLSKMATQIRDAGIDNMDDNYKSWMKDCTSLQIKIINYLVENKEIQFRFCDVDQPFNQHSDNSVDIIYLGQMIEHLNPIYTIPKFLNECYRMLKPGGTIRITTPDLDILINAYNNGTLSDFNKDQPNFYKNADPASKLSYIMFASAGLHSKQNNYEGHMFLFNKKSMTTTLNKAGFKNVQFFDEETISYNPIIKHEVNDEGWSHSLVVEAIK